MCSGVCSEPSPEQEPPADVETRLSCSLINKNQHFQFHFF